MEPVPVSTGVKKPHCLVDLLSDFTELPEITMNLRPAIMDTSTTISTLPPEVLQEIFLSQQGFISAKIPSSLVAHSCVMSRSCRPFCWMAVAHVSRQWRAIALACPPLWSRFVVSTDPQWTAELLHRSHNAPLSIMLRLSAERMDAQQHSFAMVLNHLSRIEDLHIFRQTHFSLSSTIVSMLSGRAPRLRSFSSCGFLASSDLSEATDIPEILSSENSPRLESLILSGPFNGSRFTGPCASTLKHLKMVTLTKQFCRWPSTPVLLDVLSAAPLLETLIFERRELDATFVRYVHTGMRHATLPRLHALTLASADVEVVAILDHLDLPAIRHFEVSTELTRVTATAFASALQRHFAALGAIHELNIEGASTTRAQSLQLSGSGIDHATPREGAHWRLLTLHLQECHDAMQVAGEICRRLALHEVCSLQVECTAISASAWAALLELMHNLSELVVIGTLAAMHLPRALRPGTVSISDAGNASSSSVRDAARRLSLIPLPALHSLRLTRVCMDQRCDDSSGALDSYSQGLCASLRARGEAGAPLQELTLDHCYTGSMNKTTLLALRSAMEELGGRLSETCDGDVI